MRTAGGFDADVTVTDLTTGRGPASARSLNAVATLGARHGDELLVCATGPQAKDALDAIERLAGEGFGEPAETRPTAPWGSEAGSPGTTAAAEAAPVGPPPPGTVLEGLPGSPGRAP